MPKSKQKATVISQKEIAPGIFDLRLETDLASQAGAGQFVGVYPHNGVTLLPRPISICEADQAQSSLRLVYRVAGQGTREFSTLKAGDGVYLLGVLGNGFPIQGADGKCVFLMGGGIGIPPMVQLAKELRQRGRCSQIHIFIGFRDTLFLTKDLEQYGTVHIATEDGSTGTRGTVIDAVGASGVNAGIIMACGPLPMLRAIQAYAVGQEIPAFISLEEKMACGVGACLGCVCRTHQMDHHSHVNNARICTDGPVFEAKEVEL